jgi:hypothetical protein
MSDIEALLADLGDVALPGDSQEAQSRASRGASLEATLALKLIAIVENERHAPEILPYPAGILSLALGKLYEQERRIKSLADERRDDEIQGRRAMSMLPFRPEDLYHLEYQRIQFIVTEVIRTRLHKIHRFASRIVAKPEEFENALSPNERLVAQRLHELTHDALLAGGLRLLPTELQSALPGTTATPGATGGGASGFSVTEGEESLPRADLTQYVFAVSLETVMMKLPGIADATRVDPGTTWASQYGHFKEFVLQGTMRLV